MEHYIQLLHSSAFGAALQISATAILCVYGASFFARFYWLFDLFVHFKIQYFFCSALIGLLFIANGNIIFAIIMLSLAFWIFSELQKAYSKCDQSASEGSNFTLIQYNKFYFNNGHKRIRHWLERLQPQADIVLINEAFPKDIEAFKTFKDIYPHQYPETTTQRFHNILILSKHPINVTRLSLFENSKNETRHALKVTLQKDDLGIITVYAYHASVPAGSFYSSRRNNSLQKIAEIVAQDSEKNIVLAGDWNITAFSPFFQKAVNISGLQNQKTSLFPQTTWPSFNFFSFLKIPIDHILFSQNITAIDIHKGPSLGSDHHPLVAHFQIKPVNNKA